MLYELVGAHHAQTSLFEASNTPRAAEGIDKPWHARAARRTPRYTTNWEQLPLVRAASLRAAFDKAVTRSAGA